MSPPTHRIEVVGRLRPDQVREVRALVARATDADGVPPLSEHVALHLRYGGDEPVRNLLLYAGTPAGEGLSAYAHLDVTDTVEGSSAELVVDPPMRHGGLGRALVQRLVRETPDGRLRLWAHGGHPDAARLAEGMGFVQSRSLWQMRRSLFAPLPEAKLPAGVAVWTFEPGRDDEEWVALNAKAFADHPEQGGWTVDDLRRRLREPWFDPAGFFVAVRQVDGAGGAGRGDGVGGVGGGRAERMVGFHWTKVHGGNGSGSGDGPGEQGHGHDPIGEVYVVGVDPSEQGNGLGRALTLVGLRHLRALGLPAAMLYVEEDNAAAIRLYTRLGFTRWDTDVMFRRT